MDFIEHSLIRFEKVLNSLDCACDDAYGIPCTIHDDKRFVALAIEQYARLKAANQQKGGEQ